MFLKGDWETCFKIELPNADDRQQVLAKGRSKRVANSPSEARYHAPSVAKIDRGLHESEESNPRGVANLDSSSRTFSHQASANGLNLPPWMDYSRCLLEKSATKASQVMQIVAVPSCMGLSNSVVLGGDVPMSMIDQYAPHGVTTGLDMMMSCFPTSDSGGHAMPGRIKNMSLGSVPSIHDDHGQLLLHRLMGGQITTLSDTAVCIATREIVSAAIDALSPKSRMESILSTRVDATADLFLMRSNARLSYPPFSFTESRNMALHPHMIGASSALQLYALNQHLYR